VDSCRAWHEVAICSLAALHKGARGVVSAIAEGNGTATIGDVAGSTIVRRLMELGFVPGERIEVIEEQRPGGDPIAVRVGCSIFALRRREAQAVMIRVDGEAR
jgi:ferrous iron transport protein A